MKTRRQILKTAAIALAGNAIVTTAKAAGPADLVGEIGVTTGSFFVHDCFTPTPGKIRMLDLPTILHNELDMRVIDLMSRTLESFEPAYLEKMRKAAADNDCVITNLKCNQRGIDIASKDTEKRRHGVQTYKDSIDAARLLGARWIRPVAGGGKNPDRDLLVDSLRQLIDYGADHESKVTLILENTGWVGSDSQAIPDIIRRVGRDTGLDAGPDTGNWTDDTTRYTGLAAAYPLAVTTDYKVFAFEADGSHPKYDLKRCFDTGWNAGFRGPWCIEHFHETLPGLLKGFAKIHDQLHEWIDAKG